jgi:ribose transport system ATP-binding protein
MRVGSEAPGLERQGSLALHASVYENEPVLRVRALTKVFGATRALHGVDLTVVRGEIHALLGENGAGKSTLIKILAGIHAPDSGELLLDGKPIQPWLRRERLPISFIHQDLGLIDSMTITENIALTSGFPMRRRLISWPEAAGRARAVLAQLGMPLDVVRRISTLTAAERSIVAIARALAQDCLLLVLDEPTATLPIADSERLFEALSRLKGRGIGIIYVSHRLDEVFRIADRASVLRNGESVATAPIAETTPEELVVKIIGKPPAEFFRRPAPPQGEVVLEVDGLEGGGVGPVSFKLTRGETLGLVGLRGAGQEIVGRMLFGLLPRASGAVRRNGASFAPTSVSVAMSQGLGFVSSRRNEESVAASLTVRENLFLNPRSSTNARHPSFSLAAERRRAHEVMVRFGVRPLDAGERAIATLSGGNAQKVVLARWFELGSEILILEEPTMGVDVGAKSDIYALLQDGLTRGCSALLISTDFEEVARVCNRALVFVDGRISAEVPQTSLSVDALTRLASSA